MNIKLNQYNAIIIGILLAVTLIASGCSPAATPSPTAIPPTPTPDLFGLVKAYEAAVNQHDLEATMALFADNATYNWYQWTTAVVKQEIIDYHKYFSGLNGEVQNTGCTVEGSVVKCQAVLRHDCSISAGMDGEHYTFEYNIKNGKIQQVTSIELDKDFTTLFFFYQRMSTWVLKNYPEEHNKLWGANSSEGFPWKAYNQESGNLMSKLCKEYVDKKP